MGADWLIQMIWADSGTRAAAQAVMKAATDAAVNAAEHAKSKAADGMEKLEEFKASSRDAVAKKFAEWKVCVDQGRDSCAIIQEDAIQLLRDTWMWATRRQSKASQTD